MVKKAKIIKAYFNAPIHRRSKRLSAALSDSLREKYGITGVRIRKDDVVKIMSGEYKEVEGKVTHIHISDGPILRGFRILIPISSALSEIEIL